MCDDPSIRFLFQEGTCNIQLTAEEWHGGLWTCDASPYYNSFNDQMQLVVSQDDRWMEGSVLWKDGWRAALLWTAISVTLIIIFITILLCISGVCPSL